MNTTPKRYILLKDLPTAKAGTIYYNEHGNYYTAKQKGTQVEYSWVVEKHPDWFEEVIGIQKEMNSVKKYKLLKDLPFMTKAGTIFYLTNKGNRTHYRSQNDDGIGSFITMDQSVVENSSDWFEEVKDAPFRADIHEMNLDTPKIIGWFRQSFITTHKLDYDQVDKISKAIEDIVNGVDAPDIDQLQREAFFAGRSVNSRDFTYPHYEDYKQSKK